MLKNIKEKFRLKSTNSKPVQQIEDEGRKKTEETPVAPVHPSIIIPESPVTIAIIGVGSRGKVYADYAKHNPWMATVVAVCDFSHFRCEQISKEHNIKSENIFVGGWELMAKVPKLADAVVICTPDREHVGPAEAFADLKYHILLEKPISVEIDECVRIYKAVKRNGILFTAGHIIPYNMYFRCMKKIIDSGVLGDIVSIQHIEMIGYFHFAHSYVRGNWHKESSSSFTLLTKCCHDFDLLAFLMQQKCKSISSFGSLFHFKKENKPKEAGDATICMTCPIKDTCPYSAEKIYLDRFKSGCTGWPVNVVQPKEPIDIENLTEALQSTNYGRCVYEMDNDVCDQQVVNMEFENGSTVSFTMMAFTNGLIRKTRIFGSMGELEGDGGLINVTDFRTKITKKHNPLFEMIEPGPIQWSGHGGGDFALMRAFVLACSSGDESHLLTRVEETLESHIYVFAAEESRRTGQTVDIQKFKEKYQIPDI